jgi:uncharacterized protein YdeI (YjbR/CyaY-like superfamily)
VACCRQPFALSCRRSEQNWLQKFTPRSDKSVWSKINKAKALALINAGQMKPAGLDEVERAKRDGRWDAAYDSAGSSVVPGDFQSALDGNARARNFFAGLDSRNAREADFAVSENAGAARESSPVTRSSQATQGHKTLSSDFPIGVRQQSSG